MERDDPRARAFEAVVHQRDADGLRALFQEAPELVEVIDAPWFHFGAPAVVQAAGWADRALLDALLDLGADIESRSEWDAGPYTALHRTVDGPTPEKLQLAEHLLERGARLDIHTAAGLGRTADIERILDAEPDRVSEAGPDGATPLHLAKNVEVAALLLDYGAEIDKRCVDHNSTPVMWLARDRVDVVRFLVDHGATPDLYTAALLDDRALAEQILSDDASAIHARVYFGQSHEHLGGGDKYVWTLDGAETPLELARRRGSDAVYSLLLERSDPATRLVQASLRGDVDEISWILSEDPGLMQSMEERQLCEALLGTPEAVVALLERGANPNVRDDRARATPLHHAAWRNEPVLARVLLAGGADPSMRDADYSATPLGWANEAGNRELMHVILDYYEPDLLDASWLGDTERVRAILAHDASEVNGPSPEASPLRSAAWSGHAEIVMLLLQNGASPAEPHPANGRTALDYARDQGHDGIVRMLEDWT